MFGTYFGNTYFAGFYALYDVFLSLSETSSGADSVAIKRYLTLSETSNGTETTSIINRFSLSESGSGVDSQSLRVFLTIADTVVGVDTEILKAYLSLLDTASANEVLAIYATLSIDDSGVGVDFLPKWLHEMGYADEVVSIINKVSLSETAVASESLVQYAWVSLSELASGLDTIISRFRKALLTASVQSNRVTSSVLSNKVESTIKSNKVIAKQVIEDVYREQSGDVEQTLVGGMYFGGMYFGYYPTTVSGSVTTRQSGGLLKATVKQSILNIRRIE